jgi:hypothetical protein
MAVLAGKLAAGQQDCAPLAGKSTLNRLELSRLQSTRYQKISHNPIAIKRLLVDLFLEAHEQAPSEIILDLDATDDPVHGNQEGRFFHRYYDCYCYLPLYIFCGRHLLAARLQPASVGAASNAVEEVARIVAHIRRRWPHTRILLRADSGFAHEALMAWCEVNGVHFLFGLQQNRRPPDGPRCSGVILLMSGLPRLYGWRTRLDVGALARGPRPAAPRPGGRECFPAMPEYPASCEPPRTGSVACGALVA